MGGILCTASFFSVPLASSTECLPLIRAMLQLNPAKRPSALHCLLDADFFSAYPIYESIHGMYKPPLLEEHLVLIPYGPPEFCSKHPYRFF